MRYASCSRRAGAAHQDALRALDGLAVLELLPRRLGVLPRRRAAPCARDRGEADRRIEHARRRRLRQERDRRRRGDVAIAQRERVIAAEQHDADAGNVCVIRSAASMPEPSGMCTSSSTTSGTTSFARSIRLATRGHFGHDRVAERAEQIDEQRARVVVVLGDQDADA